jgi:hypothetical protein
LRWRRRQGTINDPQPKLVDFAREPFLVLNPKYAPGYLEWTRSIFPQTRFKPAKTILVESAEALFSLIGAGSA